MPVGSLLLGPEPGPLVTVGAEPVGSLLSDSGPDPDPDSDSVGVELAASDLEGTPFSAPVPAPLVGDELKADDLDPPFLP